MIPEWQGELEALLEALDVSVEFHAPAPRARGGAMVYADRTALNDQIAALRVEVEATLARVLALAREGRIDLTTRDDIILVLRALLQPKGVATQRTQREATHDWEFASAASVLRFCRLILHLTQAAGDEYP